MNRSRAATSTGPRPTWGRALRGAAVVVAVAVLVCACAVHVVAPAGDAQVAAPGKVIVEGRINYVIDGEPMTPYGAFKPAWPAPFVNALRLETGEVHSTPPVARADGSFRWQLEPGAYVVSRIGFGTFTDDTYIAWPRIVLCAPPLTTAPVHVGHLRLEGRRYDEEFRSSTGKVSRVQGVRYTFSVADESGAARHVRLMQLREDLPIGDALVEQWKADRAGLIARACGASGS
jgi:hypothetical protein